MGRKRNGLARDREAADLLRRLRTDQGLSPEALSVAIREKAVAAGLSAARMSVSGDTIRQVERTSREPLERVKFALAFYFGLKPGHIWKRDELVQGAVLEPSELELAA